MGRVFFKIDFVHTTKPDLNYYGLFWTMNEVLIPILFGWDVVNIGYMEQNIVGHMSTFFVCILFISKLHGYAIFQNLSLPALKRIKERILIV